MWRNPEARRQVVAQVIDYATQLSRWSYQELLDAVRKVRPDVDSGDPLIDIMSKRVEAFDEKRFTDTLARNLRRGRMLLLIAGDGIHESVEQIADTLAGAPQLGFTLGLVEMSLFRLPDSPGAFIVQPRIVTRTREVVRAIVEIRGEVRPEDVHVKLPSTDEDREPGKRVSLTEEEFYQRLAAETSQSTAGSLREFVSDIRDLDPGVTIIGRQASLSLHYIDPSSNHRFSFGSIKVDGGADFRFVRYYIMDRGLPEQIALDYLNVLSQLVPGSRVDLTQSRGGDMNSAIKVGSRHVRVDELLPHADRWLSAIDTMIAAINRSQKETP